MNEVTVSSKYQVVIPLEIRTEMSIRKGQKMRVIRCGNRIELIPKRTIAEMEGAFPGLSSEGLRDEEDRF
jgi:AbrB family looped-hinge helix DNA binding protein